MIGQKLKTAPPTEGHVFQQTGTTFELNQDIIKTNILTNFELGRDFIGAKLLTKFYEDGTTNVASRTDQKSSPEQSVADLRPQGIELLLATFEMKKYPALKTEMFFNRREPISKSVHILLEQTFKFHEDWTNNVTS
ncbi:hypothetical protein DPMN_016620 [Dreissena polymorpha]|uniref:Uncharacterized protein n=1 Tax=Dreissena polymorpha TaxID=45954 RepID=A0A9D4S7C8_DREPO|nr:hypothetical protein DPMN_016620 [Dreissena polymorpha]